MTMESSPAASRARQATTKLTGVRRCSLRPARTFATRRGCSSSAGDVMFRGAADLMARDLPLAFADVADRTVQDGLTSAADDARQRHRRVHGGARDEGAPERNRCLRDRHGQRRGAVSRRGADRIAGGDAAGDRRARAAEERGPISKRPRSRGRTAPAGDRLEVWRGVLEDHPKRGEVVGGGAEGGRRTAGVHPRAAPGRPAGRRARRRRGRASVRSRPGVDALVAAARAARR